MSEHLDEELAAERDRLRDTLSRTYYYVGPCGEPGDPLTTEMLGAIPALVREVAAERDRLRAALDDSWYTDFEDVVEERDRLRAVVEVDGELWRLKRLNEELPRRYMQVTLVPAELDVSGEGP